jgi:hypothetical protein
MVIEPIPVPTPVPVLSQPRQDFPMLRIVQAQGGFIVYRDRCLVARVESAATPGERVVDLTRTLTASEMKAVADLALSYVEVAPTPGPAHLVS